MNALGRSYCSGQPTGTWTHVAAVFVPGARVELWVGGLLNRSKTTTASVVDDPKADVRIGCYKDGSFLAAALDDLRIYTRALTAMEIARLAQ